MVRESVQDILSEEVISEQRPEWWGMARSCREKDFLEEEEQRKRPRDPELWVRGEK